MQKHTEEKALNDIPLSERQKGEKEARINIPASKSRGSCLRSSNVSNDTDKSFSNNLNAEDAVSDDAKQQSVVSSTENNSDIISRTSCSHPDELSKQSNAHSSSNKLQRAQSFTTLQRVSAISSLFKKL